MPLQLLCLTSDAHLIQTLTDSLSSYKDTVNLTFTDQNNPDTALLEKAEGVLTGHFPLSLRAQCPNLRWVQYWSAGVDGKLYPELFANNNNEITVCTGSGIHSASCSEHVIAMMLAFARGLPQSFHAQKEKNWEARGQIAREMFTLEGKTVGIVGAGTIGQAIGKRCQAFGMRTVGTRRDVSRPTEGIDVLLSHIQYHDLILESDFIVLALPLTPNTQMLFGEDEIEILRVGTYLINIGRGGLVDEAWLYKALKNKWLAGAGLDVFAEEPLPATSPLWELPNVIITPHTGGNHPSYWAHFAQLVEKQLGLYLAGKTLGNRVDKDLGY
jgi:phosphoglycerate dehydrogenase-like enzyme